MHFSELTAPEQRVLGCLIEKRWTTPDQYPLSLNALRLACNQSTNRDPVTDYDEHTVREAAQRLSKYGLARLASGHSSRAIKYRHLAEEALGLGREELAVLCVLLLRGPQTPGELKGRSERMAQLESLERRRAGPRVLIERGYARRLERRPGQKEDRFKHLLGGRRCAANRAGARRRHVVPAAPKPRLPSFPAAQRRPTARHAPRPPQRRPRAGRRRDGRSSAPARPRTGSRGQPSRCGQRARGRGRARSRAEAARASRAEVAR